MFQIHAPNPSTITDFLSFYNNDPSLILSTFAVTVNINPCQTFVGIRPVAVLFCAIRSEGVVSELVNRNEVKF